MQKLDDKLKLDLSLIELETAIHMAECNPQIDLNKTYKKGTHKWFISQGLSDSCTKLAKNTLEHINKRNYNQQRVIYSIKCMQKVKDLLSNY